MHAFRKIDILFCCTSEAVVGTVEELSTNHHTLTLVRDQFDKNFFGPMNIIRAVVPQMRSQMNGHIIVLTGVTGLSAHPIAAPEADRCDRSPRDTRIEHVLRLWMGTGGILR